MEEFDPKHLRRLLGEGGAVRLSCYMPMTIAGRDTRKNPIRFKNSMREAERALRAHGVPNGDISKIVGPLVADTEQRRFWDHQREGLAAFASLDEHMLLSCNECFRPNVSVGEHYCVVPLLPLVNRNRHGYVLVLSLNRVRLVDITRDHAEEVELDESVPQALTDVVGKEREDRDQRFQRTGGGGPAHPGRADSEDETLPELEQFCRRVDEALANEVDHADSPIVAAGDVKVTSVFRQVAKHLAILDTIPGNHDRTPVDELHGFAWPMLADRINEYDAALVELFHERYSEQRASDSAEEITRAAKEGRIDTLLLNREAAIDGGLDGPREVSPGENGEVAGESLFNVTATATLRHGGAARLLVRAQMPTAAPMAAIYRY